MKKTILGLMPLVVASMLLAGCGSNKASSAPSSSSEAPVSSSSAVSYNLAGVVADFEAALSEAFGQAVTFQDMTEDYGFYYFGAYFATGAQYDGTATEDLLKPIVTQLLTIVPEYMENSGDHFFTAEEDYWDDGSGDTAYVQLLDTPDEAVGVQFVSYGYNSKLNVQILIFENAE